MPVGAFGLGLAWTGILKLPPASTEMGWEFADFVKQAVGATISGGDARATWTRNWVKQDGVSEVG